MAFAPLDFGSIFFILFYFIYFIFASFSPTLISSSLSCPFLQLSVFLNFLPSHFSLSLLLRRTVPQVGLESHSCEYSESHRLFLPAIMSQSEESLSPAVSSAGFSTYAEAKLSLEETLSKYQTLNPDDDTKEY